MLIKEIKLEDGTVYKGVVAEDSKEFEGFIRVVFVHDSENHKAGSMVHFNRNLITCITLN